MPSNISSEPRESPSWFFSAKYKILLLVCGSVLCSCLLVGGFFYAEVSKNAHELQLKELSTQAKIISPFFQAAFNAMRSDIVALSRVEPVQEIMQGMTSAHDNADRHAADQAKKRLEDIFASVISSKSSYVQIRYIGLADGGRELVRVNRDGETVSRVLPQDLQRKAQEPYFKTALKLKPGQVYFSVVSLNREHGKVQQPFLPVIRALIPVYDKAGKTMFGFLAINASYERILNDAIKPFARDKTFYVVNEFGDYILFKAHNKDYQFHFMPREGNVPQKESIKKVLASDQREGTFFEDTGEDKTVFYFLKLFYHPFDHKRYIAVVVSTHESSLMQPIYMLQRRALLLIMALTLVASLPAGLFALVFMRPLNQMKEQIAGYHKGEQDLNFPVSAHDEVGELARAFRELITNLDRSRQETVDTRNKLQAILDNTVDGLITINKEGIIQNYNKACENIFGYTSKEVMGENVKILMPSPYRQAHDTYLNNYHETGEKKIIGIGREVEGQRKDGTIFPLDLSVSEVTVQGQSFYSGIVRDISDRKKAEDEIMRSNDELERFAYVASHDLQEPLRMISNFTQLLEEEYSETFDQQAGEYMAFIIDAAHRMQDLVNDLLEYSRIGYEDSGFLDFDAKLHTEMVISNLQELIQESNAKIVVKDLPVIWANPTRFLRLMQNLIGNGIKYRRKDVTPEITIQAKKQDREWLFSVEDNGIGIKEEYLKQIFIIFRRLHAKHEYQGTGIGLAVCKKIVDSFEGTIWAESTPGKGSVFYFTVPEKISAEP